MTAAAFAGNPKGAQQRKRRQHEELLPSWRVQCRFLDTTNNFPALPYEATVPLLDFSLIV